MIENPSKISIIGIRAYPSEFRGTSGVEVYIDKVLSHLKVSGLSWTLYTKALYQNGVNANSQCVVRKIPIIHSKTLESISYSFLASVLSCFDGSSTVWFQGTGMAMFCLLPKLFGKKIVVTVHGFDWERKKWSVLEKRLFYRVTKHVLHHADVITAVSDTMQKRLQDEFSIDSVVTKPGVEFKNKSVNPDILSKYQLKKNKYILYVARLVPEKRVEWLLDAFLEYKRGKPSALKLVIVGSHGNLAEYERTLKEKYHHQSIVWLGFVANNTRDILLSSCRLYVLPSEVEGGNPLSFLEALSYNCYTLVPNESVTENFKSMKKVTFFNKNSFQDFKKKLFSLIDKNSQSVKSDTNDAETSMLRNMYSWKKTAEEYQKILSG